jgi:hypothetical protein
MVRIGAVALILFSFFVLFGCGDETTGTKETGLNLSFDTCLTFEAWVYIGGLYEGAYSSDVPSFIAHDAGSFPLFVRSNVVAGDTSYCWEETITINEGETSYLRLCCRGRGCRRATACATSQ